MMHHLLTDALESGILGQVGDIAVHLAIHLDVLHHLATVGFQSTIEVVQIMYA